MAPQAPPPQVEVGAGPGGRDPTPASKRGGCPAAARLATCPRRSRYPSLAGFRLLCPCRSGRRPRGETADVGRGEVVSRQPSSSSRGWLAERWQRCHGCVRARRPWGPIASPSRPASGGRKRAARGLIATALGLITEDAQTSTAVAAPGTWRGAALAASPPNSQPQPSRAASSDDPANGNDSAGDQRAEPPGRPDKRDGNAHNDQAGGKNKPGKGKDKPGKGKGK
jgi:hypothetical protein